MKSTIACRSCHFFPQLYQSLSTPLTVSKITQAAKPRAFSSSSAKTMAVLFERFSPVFLNQ